MKPQPRLNLLDTWKGVAATSLRDGKWVWGGRYQSNSVSDAQQLLCIMFPAAEIGSFALASPDRTDEDALAALTAFGGALDIPVLIVRVLNDHLDRYTAEDGTPLFPGGSHFLSADPEVPPTSTQQSQDVVESFATALTLMLTTISFARTFLRGVTREDLKQDLERLEKRAGRRLTAAMVGLLRSFTVNTFDSHTFQGQALLRTVNQANRPERRVVSELREELTDVMAGLRDLGLGSGQGKDFSGANRLFECGWSWGVIHGTEPIEFAVDAGLQAPGVASDEAYLYFTMVALDGISDLFSDRTRRANLLDEDQQRLARALHIRWDLTQQYWSVLSDFGPGTWPLEDIPWRATDGIESDYLSLLVAGVAMRDLTDRRADDFDLDRLSQVLIDLTRRARITRRPLAADPMLSGLHDPGFQLELVSINDTDGPPAGPQLIWPVQDIAAVLLKRTVRVAGMFKDTELRSQMIRLADVIWEHLERRRFTDGPLKFLWDQPSQAYPTITRTYAEPSWQMTIRVVESLVIAANLVAGDPLRNERLYVIARDMVNEAEHLLDQELLGGADQAGPAMRRTIQSITTNLQRAKDVIAEKPGSAMALVNQVLLELERLAAAREDSTWAR